MLPRPETPAAGPLSLASLLSFKPILVSDFCGSDAQGLVSAAAFTSRLLRAWAGLSFPPLDLGFYFEFLLELNFPLRLRAVLWVVSSPALWLCLIPHKILPPGGSGGLCLGFASS